MKGLTVAVIAMAFLSLYPILSKVLLNSVSPLAILISVQVLASMILIGLLNVSKKIRELKDMVRRDIVLLCLISLISSVMAPMVLLAGLKLTSVTNTVLIAKAEAILMSLFAVIFLKERMTFHQIAGTMVMFSGIVLISVGDYSGLTYPNPGDLLVLASALLYAIGTTLFKKYLRHLPPEVIVTMRSLAGAIMLLVIATAFMDLPSVFSVTGPLSWEFASALLGLVIMATIVGQFLWYKALEITSATRVSIAMLLSPVIGVFYAVTLLGEALMESQIVGGILITTGLVIMEFHIRQVKGPLKRKFHLRLRHMHHA